MSSDGDPIDDFVVSKNEQPLDIDFKCLSKGSEITEGLSCQKPSVL